MSWRSAAVALVMLAVWLSAAVPSRAEDPDPTGSLLDPGQLVVTGFSGTVVSDTAAADPASPTKVDGTFIDPDGAAMRILDVGGIPQGAGETDKRAAEAFSLTAREIGQVYGVAIDDYENPATGKPAPNIYLGATSSYGLHIVVPDRDGTGWPKRVVTGDPEAQWMEGQFGTGLGGDPGTLWKIDGVTGKPAAFSRRNLTENPTVAPASATSPMTAF